jgi:transposase
MSFHRNAKLGLAGRYALVSAVAGGMTLKAAAAVFSVSPATAHRWWHRWLDASEEARTTLSCLFDRPSWPRRSPRQLAPELAEAICECRRTTGWGPRLVAGATGFGHSTVSKVLTDLAVAAAGAGTGQPLTRRGADPAELRQRDLSSARVPSGALVRVVPVLFVRDSIFE